MKKQSAGILAYRVKDEAMEYLLVRPGGPFFRNKDLGAWSIPKGELTAGEAPLAAAIREFEEELGVVLHGPFTPLQPVTQKAGKVVYAWAVAADVDTTAIRCNTFAIEWPPRSGKMQEFPEIDKAEWFAPDAAKQKINPAQVPLLEELENIINNKT